MVGFKSVSPIVLDFSKGSALEDFIRPDKVIIGCRTIKAEKILKKIYKPLNRPYVVTNNETAEVIKYANNGNENCFVIGKMVEKCESSVFFEGNLKKWSTME